MYKFFSISFISLFVIYLSIGIQSSFAQTNSFEIENLDYTITNDGIRLSSTNLGNGKITIDGEEKTIPFVNGQGEIKFDADHKGELHFLKSSLQKKLVHVSKRKDGSLRVKKIPLWMSILPPLIAIFLALLFKEVIVSLFAGIWVGAFLIGGMRIESLYYFLLSIFETVSKFVLEALTDGGHLSVIIFSLLIGGMVAIISKNGGMAGVVLSLSKYAKTARSTQFITWLLGVAIFFDDYANILIVGNTMRNMTDKFKISREKLAYIVDSTAAPVSAVAFITTWIGAELGYIDSGMASVDGPLSQLTPYAIFVSSLKYSFYPIMTLIFILILIYTQKDFGLMLKAEERAETTGQVSPAASISDDEPNMENLDPVEGAPLKWQNAVFPVLTVILVTIFGLVDTGMSSLYNELVSNGQNLTNSYGSIWGSMPALFPDGNASFVMKIGKLIGGADSYTALLWSSMSGLVVAIALTVGGKIIKLFDTMHVMTTGFKTMMPALIILTLAWSLAIATNELHTADYITALLQDSISPYFMPPIIFVLSAAIAFSTGSSWSTMAILYPIAIPTTWAVSVASGLDPGASSEILLNVIATVLAASVLGDHCSPISDTTILSSLATDCNHIDHVRTQLPYALTVGGTCLVLGTVSTLLGGGWFISFLLIVLSSLMFYFIISKFGKRVRA